MKSYTLLRGSIYSTIAMLTAFSGWLKDLATNPDKLSQLTWVDWGMMASAVIVSGLTALRAYIDGSAQRNRTNEKTTAPNS